MWVGIHAILDKNLEKQTGIKNCNVSFFIKNIWRNCLSTDGFCGKFALCLSALGTKTLGLGQPLTMMFLFGTNKLQWKKVNIYLFFCEFYGNSLLIHPHQEQGLDLGHLWRENEVSLKRRWQQTLIDDATREMTRVCEYLYYLSPNLNNNYVFKLFLY